MRTTKLVVAVLIIGLLLAGAFYVLKPSRETAELPPQEQTDYLVQVNAGCAIQDQTETTILLETEQYRFLSVKLTEREAERLKGHECVVRVSTPQEAREKYDSLPEETKEAVRDKIRELKLKRTILDVPEVPRELVSEYQLYVTPNDGAVQSLSGQVNGYKAAYSTAVGWVWISDNTLHHVAEKWLKPHEFLVDTPDYASNPVKGRIASDCSEQANALASLLRAEGASAEDVRVVLGLVNFDGSIGGHAWVEVYDGGVWMPLEATSGPYYDDEKRLVVEGGGLPFTYFKFFPYPVVDKWVYYNDQYFYDVETRKGNYPTSWVR